MSEEAPAPPVLTDGMVREDVCRASRPSAPERSTLARIPPAPWTPVPVTLTCVTSSTLAFAPSGLTARTAAAPAPLTAPTSCPPSGHSPSSCPLTAGTASVSLFLFGTARSCAFSGQPGPVPLGVDAEEAPARAPFPPAARELSAEASADSPPHPASSSTAARAGFLCSCSRRLPITTSSLSASSATSSVYANTPATATPRAWA